MADEPPADSTPTTNFSKPSASMSPPRPARWPRRWASRGRAPTIGSGSSARTAAFDLRRSARSLSGCSKSNEQGPPITVKPRMNRLKRRERSPKYLPNCDNNRIVVYANNHDKHRRAGASTPAGYRHRHSRRDMTHPSSRIRWGITNDAGTKAHNEHGTQTTPRSTGTERVNTIAAQIQSPRRWDEKWTHRV